MPVLFLQQEDGVSGPNSYRGKLGDEEASILLADGKGAAHFKKCATGVAEDDSNNR